MATNTQTSKEQQITIEANDKVELHPLPGSFRGLCGILHRPGEPPATIEEMDEAVGRYLAEDDERIQKGWLNGRV